MRVILKLSCFLAAVLMIFGPARSQEIFRESASVFSTGTMKAKTSKGGIRRLIIKSASDLAGELTIKTSKTDQVVVKYAKKARTDTKSKAIDYIDLIALSLSESPQGVVLAFRAPNPAPWSEAAEAGLVNAEITLPENCAVEIYASYFDVEASGPFSGMLIPSSLGRIEVSDVTGPVELVTYNRRVTVRQLTGEISVTTNNSIIEAYDVSGSAKFKNDGGDISIDGMNGQLNVSNNYGRIEIDDFRAEGQKNFIRGFSGPIVIGLSFLGDAQLIALNRYEDIEIVVPSDLSAMLSLAVGEQGRIEATNLELVSDFIETNRLNLTAGDGLGKIKGEIRGEGNIYVIGSEK